MKPSNPLPGHVARVLDHAAADLDAEQKRKLTQARERALARFDAQAAEAESPRERLGLWAQRHVLSLRRGGLALGFALLTGAGMMLAEDLLLEEEAVDAALLAQDLPFEALLEPHFSRGLHE
ncbi:hypothetical protein HNO92_001058 [Chromobacterium alkanivorans]|uniref:DUF3619 family protein n=1 Tax=Chromobacterium TaxID=535 RepID=UPI00065405DD|nr:MULTISPECIES: DUF3619 family protein [Chromobacterium]KMN82844.1 hypothetical protein VK98_04885 [Chromobacterium sp. LK11]MBN3002198.1 DUF3619 family protein [Chromobacterium alkanivorans]MCS3803398.1 hypothetical protein [Chromobacterium alkanivorans]MCS3817492.1 hypothetical protein [Chromobacterium alkanivorans]MCS3872764.1 hypothetical protein [Chromobacterium alkanivorans]